MSGSCRVRGLGRTLTPLVDDMYWMEDEPVDALHNDRLHINEGVNHLFSKKNKNKIMTTFKWQV